jgi:septation ring formation regulator EzrA
MTLATKLRDNKAVHAGAGAVDLAVEKLREVPVHVTKLQDTAKENASKLQETARENASKLQENVKGLQDKVDTKDLPGAAVAYVTHLGTRVAEVIDELAERGKTVVNRVDVDVQVPELGEPKPTPRAKAATAKKSAQSAAKKSGS